MKNFIIGLIIVIVVGLGIYFIVKTPSTSVTVNDQTGATTTDTTVGSIPAGSSAEGTVIGQSVQGRPITAYTYGTGSTKLLFVGGIHGGYEWNTVALAYQLNDYLKANPSAIPASEQVTVIPVLNPDGLNKVVGTTTENFTAADVSSSQSIVTAGRFNANNVDLGRNFDCDWKTTGLWQTKTVSGGSAPFSEPESAAFQNYVTSVKPSAAVVFYSSAGGVYSSACDNGILPDTATLNSLYAKAAGYPSYQAFTAYSITGDTVDWLAKENIPAISVLLTDHTNTEWAKNWAGIQAVLNHYAQ